MVKLSALILSFINNSSVYQYILHIIQVLVLTILNFE